MTIMIDKIIVGLLDMRRQQPTMNVVYLGAKCCKFSLHGLHHAIDGRLASIMPSGERKLV